MTNKTSLRIKVATKLLYPDSYDPLRPNLLDVINRILALERYSSHNDRLDRLLMNPPAAMEDIFENTRRILGIAPHRIPLEDVDMSFRLYNCLRNAHINYLSDVSQYTPDEMLKFRNFGHKSLTELKVIMQTHHLSFYQKKVIQ